jgi:hypothetical protein
MKEFKFSLFVRIIRPLLNYHKPGNEKNVFIFSLPRSGSTWLMELIWSQPEFKCCNEPLNLSINNLRALTGIDGFKDLYSTGVKQRLLNYFHSIASGKVHFMDPYPLRKYFRVFTSRIVFKVIHGGEKYINDIAENSNGVVLYLLRHPIPVALSRKKLPRLDELCSPFALQEFSEEEGQLAKEIQRNGSDLEKRILAWCLQNKLALKNRNDNWLVITYEQLALDPAPVINRMVSFCGLPKPELMFEGLNKPSAVTTQSDKQSKAILKTQTDEKYDLIARWIKSVDVAQSENLMGICRKFGFDIYSHDNPLPNEAWLIK